MFRGTTADAAENFAKADPYVTNGLVTSWRVRKWATVLGDGLTLPAVITGSIRALCIGSKSQSTAHPFAREAKITRVPPGSRIPISSIP